MLKAKGLQSCSAATEQQKQQEVEVGLLKGC